MLPWCFASAGFSASHWDGFRMNWKMRLVLRNTEAKRHVGRLGIKSSKFPFWTWPLLDHSSGCVVSLCPSLALQWENKLLPDSAKAFGDVCYLFKSALITILMVVKPGLWKTKLCQGRLRVACMRQQVAGSRLRLDRLWTWGSPLVLEACALPVAWKHAIRVGEEKSVSQKWSSPGDSQRGFTALWLSSCVVLM